MINILLLLFLNNPILLHINKFFPILLFTEFLYTIFSSFAIIHSSCIVLFCVGSSIKATRSSNHHILALEANSKLFEEILEPLKKATLVSKCHDIDMFGNSSEDDEDTPTMDQPFIDLCE